LSRLRGRSRFGEAEARASTVSCAVKQGVDGRDKPGHDGVPVYSAALRACGALLAGGRDCGAGGGGFRL